MCGDCHTAKQKFLDFEKSNLFYRRYKNHAFPVLCKCRKEREETEKQRQKQIKTEMLIEKFRKEGITDVNYLKHTFFNYDSKKYVREIYHAYWLFEGVKIITLDKLF